MIEVHTLSITFKLIGYIILGLRVSGMFKLNSVYSTVIPINKFFT